MWKLLNSRKFALYLLLVFLFVLMFSTFLPNQFTLPAKKWADLERDKPVLFWLASHFSTPFVVRSPAFLVLSAFLFLSTLVCTVTRVKKWIVKRESEFATDAAFSFSVEDRSALGMEALRRRAETVLRNNHWEFGMEEGNGKVSLAALKGISLGFWGSVVFHGGLLLCFLAAPVTAFSVFRGEFLVTEGAGVPLKDGFVSHSGNEPLSLLPLTISVHDLRGIYEQGKYKVDFGGTMRVGGGSVHTEYRFGVNKPVTIKGYQFTLHEFGFSPRVIMKREGWPDFDYFLNLRHPEEGDAFSLGGESRLFMLFFPDFQKEGDRIWTKSKDPNNPVLLIKVFEGEDAVFERLLRLNEKVSSGPLSVEFAELRNWTNFIVVRDAGIPILIIGLTVGVSGLFVRFLSNERRVEMEFGEQGAETLIRLSGYSRYYPAFLEKEVRHMADMIRGES